MVSAMMMLSQVSVRMVLLARVMTLNLIMGLWVTLLVVKGVVGGEDHARGVGWSDGSGGHLGKDGCDSGVQGPWW